MEDICKNCGAWKGLHNFETLQCPRNGVEASIGQTQLWENTVYREEFSHAEKQLQQENKELLDTNVQIRVDKAKERIYEGKYNDLLQRAREEYDTLKPGDYPVYKQELLERIFGEELNPKEGE